jgi:hypothetical protein
MAVDNVGVIEVWRRLLQIMKGQKGAHAGYVGMKIVMATGASVVWNCVRHSRASVMVPFAILGVVVARLTQRRAQLECCNNYRCGWRRGDHLLAVRPNVTPSVPVAVFFLPMHISV